MVEVTINEVTLLPHGGCLTQHSYPRVHRVVPSLTMAEQLVFYSGREVGGRGIGVATKKQQNL